MAQKIHEPTRLIDAEKRNLFEPQKFERPGKAALRDVCPGDYAKIGVEFDKVPSRVAGHPGTTSGERFWVKITARDKKRLVGKIDNDLIHTAEHGLSADDRVAFGCWNILDIVEGE